MKRIKVRRLRGSYGEFDPANKQITLSNKLTKRNTPSKSFVLWHERFHAHLDRYNIQISAYQEEIMADIFALVNSKNVELSFMEIFFKRLLIKKYGKLTIKKILTLNLKKLL